MDSTVGSEGSQATAEVVLPTVDENLPPVLTITGKLFVQLPENIILQGDAIDPEGDPVTYEWSQVDGPAIATLLNKFSKQMTATNLVAGNYIFELRVADNKTNEVAQSVDVSVGPSPTSFPPIADAGNNQSIQLPINSTTLDGSGSFDPDGVIQTYLWTKESGPAGGNLSDAGVVDPTVSNLQAGTYTFRLTVTDNAGLSTSDQTNIVVTPADAVNQPPEAKAVVNPGIVTLPNNSALLKGDGSSDPDNDPLTYLWQKVGGPAQGGNIVNPTSANTPVNNLVETQAGQPYVFQLTVADTSNATSTDTVFVVVNPAPVGGGGGGDDLEISGELFKYRRVTIKIIDGPGACEGHSGDWDDSDPNPFRHYRAILACTKPSGATKLVQGFFAADGDAANTSQQCGTHWHFRIAPDEIGPWSCQSLMTRGEDIAVDTVNVGTLVPSGSGKTVDFTILNPPNPDPRNLGRVVINQGRTFYSETGEPYVKNGTNSPENFLAYKEFDNTFQKDPTHSLAIDSNFLHEYPAHVQHYVGDGSNEWQGGKGKGILGAIDYLAGVGINAIYFLTLNINYQSTPGNNLGGDSGDIWPFRGDPTTQESLLHYDVSKLDQWEQVFDYMDKRGVALHVVTQETEIDHVLGDGINGGTGASLARKLYYSELAARFGHHLGLIVNLGEEFNVHTFIGNDDQIVKDVVKDSIAAKEFAKWIRIFFGPSAIIALHTFQDYFYLYTLLAGDLVDIDMVSLQSSKSLVASLTEDLIRVSLCEPPITNINLLSPPPGVQPPPCVPNPAERWVITSDEIGEAVPLQDFSPPALKNLHHQIREEATWPVMMRGGSGSEEYYGYGAKEFSSDITAEDHTFYSLWLAQKAYATNFFKQLPLQQMEPMDDLTKFQTFDYVLANPGDIYVIYSPDGNSVDLDLAGQSGPFDFKLYNPRTGDYQQRPDLPGNNKTTNINFTSLCEVGNDCAALIKKK